MNVTNRTLAARTRARKPSQIVVGHAYRLHATFNPHKPGKAVAVVVSITPIDSRSSAVKLAWLDDHQNPGIYTLAQLRQRIWAEERMQ